MRSGGPKMLLAVLCALVVVARAGSAPSLSGAAFGVFFLLASSSCSHCGNRACGGQASASRDAESCQEVSWRTALARDEKSWNPD